MDRHNAVNAREDWNWSGWVGGGERVEEERGGQLQSWEGKQETEKS